MIFFAHTIAIVSILSTAHPSQEVAGIKKMLAQLYREPIRAFLYGDDGGGKSEAYWKTYYGNYYYDDIVNIITRAFRDCPNGYYPFKTSDPRTNTPMHEDNKLIKFRIGEPIVKGNTAEVYVRFTTSDGLTDDHRVTLYYLVKTQNGWRIADQFMSQPAGSKLRPRPDLLERLKSSCP